jgi:hypothetical protein
VTVLAGVARVRADWEVVLAVPVDVAAVDAVLDTAETREPPGPPEAPVAAEAGAASSRPMPNARHRPLTAAPKVYNSTFRAGMYQPFMPGTLIT